MSALNTRQLPIETKSTQLNRQHRVSTLITGEFPNELQTHSVKQQTQSVLFQILFNYQMNPKPN